MAEILDHYGRPYRITAFRNFERLWTAEAHLMNGGRWSCAEGRTEEEAIRVLKLLLTDYERGRRLEIAIRQVVVAGQIAARAKREAKEARAKLKDARAGEAQAQTRLEEAQKALEEVSDAD